MYLLNGTLNAAVDAAAALAQLQHGLPAALARPPALDAVLDCAERFAAALPQRAEALGLDAAAVDALQGFCRREALQAKVGHELGEQAFSLRRFDYRQPRFESWRPLGLVAHITPANAPLLPFMAVLESLLAGNVNWLRPSGSDQGRSARLLADFLSHDAAGDLAAHVAVLPLATDQLAGVLARADAVSAWGGDAALEAIRRQVPAGCRWIPWGHRISFAYLDPAAATEADYDALADDVCRFDQQACSSPQCLLVDSEDEAALRGAAQAMAAALARRAPAWPALQPDMQEAAEISSQLAMLRLAVFRRRGRRGGAGRGLARGLGAAPGTGGLAAVPHPATAAGAARAAGGTAAALAHPFAKLRPDRRAGASAGAQPPAAGRRRRPAVSGGSDARRLRRRAARRRLRAEPADAAGVGQPARWSTARPRDAGRLAAAAGRLDALPVMDKMAFQQAEMGPAAQLFFRSGGGSGEQAGRLQLPRLPPPDAGGGGRPARRRPARRMTG